MAQCGKLYSDRNNDDSMVSIKRTKKGIWSCQNTFILLTFLGIALGISFRGNVSVTIIAIAKQPIPSNNSIELEKDEFSCPYENRSNGTTDIIEGEFVMSRTERGLSLATTILGLFFSNLLGGIAADRYGGKLVTGLGVFFGSILTIAIPLAIRYSVPLFIFVRFLNGVAEGVIFPGSYQMVSFWALQKERSRIISLICSGIYFGAITTFCMSGILSKSSFLGGWPSVFYLTGGLGIIWSIFWFSLIHDSPNDHPRISHYERRKLFNISTIKSSRPKSIPFWSIFTSIPVWGITAAHCGNNFGFYLLLTEMPSFLSEILHLEISNDGVLSCLPYAACWFSTIFYSKLMTKLIMDNKLSILSVRRISTALAGYVSAACFIALCFVGCNKILASTLFILIQGMGGCQYSGFKSSFVELAPRYSGLVTGLSFSFANLAGFSSTIVMEQLVDNNPSVLGWQYGFLVAASLYAVTTTIYLATVDVEVQPWNYETTDNEMEEEANKLICSENGKEEIVFAN